MKMIIKLIGLLALGASITIAVSPKNPLASLCAMKQPVCDFFSLQKQKLDLKMLDMKDSVKSALWEQLIPSDYHLTHFEDNDPQPSMEEARRLLDLLCNNKAVTLDKISQIERVASQISLEMAFAADENRPFVCPKRVIDSTIDLDKLIRAHPESECTRGFYDDFKVFYDSYLDTSTREKAIANEHVHDAVRRFALAYGLLVAAKCRTNMVEVLLNEAREAVEERYFKELSDLIGPKGSIGEMLGMWAPELVVLPSDFVAMRRAGKKAERKLREKRQKEEHPSPEVKKEERREYLEDLETIPIVLPAIPALKRIKTICERRFKPVIEQVIMPVTLMANLGFEYREHRMKSTLKEHHGLDMGLESNKERVGQWSRAVFLCESFKNVELVETEEDAIKSRDKVDKRVRVFNEELAEEAKELLGANALLGSIEVDGPEIEWLDLEKFKPTVSAQIGDKLIHRYEPYKKLSVKLIETNRDENERIAQRYLVNLFREFFQYTRHNHFFTAFGIAFQQMRAAVEEVKTEQLADELGMKTKLVQEVNLPLDREVHQDAAASEGEWDGLFDGLAACFCCGGSGSGSGSGRGSGRGRTSSFRLPSLPRAPSFDGSSAFGNFVDNYGQDKFGDNFADSIEAGFTEDDDDDDEHEDSESRKKKNFMKKMMKIMMKHKHNQEEPKKHSPRPYVPKPNVQVAHYHHGRARMRPIGEGAKVFLFVTALVLFAAAVATIAVKVILALAAV